MIFYENSLFVRYYAIENTQKIHMKMGGVFLISFTSLISGYLNRWPLSRFLTMKSLCLCFILLHISKSPIYFPKFCTIAKVSTTGLFFLKSFSISCLLTFTKTKIHQYNKNSPYIIFYNPHILDIYTHILYRYYNIKKF